MKKTPQNKQHGEFKNLKEDQYGYMVYKDRSDKKLREIDWSQVRKSLVSHV